MPNLTHTMVTAAAFVNGKPVMRCELDIDHERIDITPEFEPDPAWTHIDSRGHFHAYTRDEQLPTLRGVQITEPCNGQCGFDPPCEGYVRTEYHCRLCDEVVEPATRRPFGRRYMDGPERWTLKIVAPVADLMPEGGVVGHSEPAQVSFWMADPTGRVTAFGFGRLMLGEVTLSASEGIAQATIRADVVLGRR